MTRDEVCKQINTVGVIPCARVNAPEHAQFAAEMLYKAGIPVVEIPLTVPKALQAIEDLAERFPDLAVGAGTVLDEESARRSIDAGARFITSPDSFQK